MLCTFFLFFRHTIYLKIDFINSLNILIIWFLPMLALHFAFNDNRFSNQVPLHVFLEISIYWFFFFFWFYNLYLYTKSKQQTKESLAFPILLHDQNVCSNFFSSINSFEFALRQNYPSTLFSFSCFNNVLLTPSVCGRKTRSTPRFARFFPVCSHRGLPFQSSPMKIASKW